MFGFTPDRTERCQLRHLSGTIMVAVASGSLGAQHGTIKRAGAFRRAVIGIVHLQNQQIAHVFLTQAPARLGAGTGT